MKEEETKCGVYKIKNPMNDFGIPDQEFICFCGTTACTAYLSVANDFP